VHQRASLPGVIRDRHTVLGGRSRNIRERVRAADTGEALRSFLFTVLRWTPRAAVGFVVGVVAVIAIFINALFMQPGLHPAPLFKPPAFESNPGHRAPKAAAGAPAQRGNPAPAPVMPKIFHASRAPGAAPRHYAISGQAGKRSPHKNRSGGPERVARRHSASANPITGTGLGRATRTERIRLWPDQANWNS
jgi:hypothetical protein